MEIRGMKMNMLLYFVKTAVAMLLVLVLVSCGSDNAGTESMLSGASSKTWKADKEISASGDKEKLTKQEKKQNLQFYADGRFATGGSSTLETGTWSYDQSAKKLSLQFENQNIQETFDVLKLTDDEMRLRAADGSEMVMKAD